MWLVKAPELIPSWGDDGNSLCMGPPSLQDGDICCTLTGTSCLISIVASRLARAGIAAQCPHPKPDHRLTWWQKLRHFTLGVG